MVLYIVLLLVLRYNKYYGATIAIERKRSLFNIRT